MKIQKMYIRTLREHLKKYGPLEKLRRVQNRRSIPLEPIPFTLIEKTVKSLVKERNNQTR